MSIARPFYKDPIGTHARGENGEESRDWSKLTKEEQERSCLVWGHDQESGPQFYGEALIIALISCIFSLHLDVGFSLNPKACLVAILS